ncbi:hypothetical protein SAT01_17770 [Sinomonas atrocyanea]|nr:hypothetical protein SAT01_17770 [Sinomonas atrocyanea]GGG81569.1 hypothetical protein GCM10007172_38760 [Sinomonas atrocyanea]
MVPSGVIRWLWRPRGGPRRCVSTKPSSGVHRPLGCRYTSGGDDGPVQITEYIDLVEDLASAVLNGEGTAAASLAQTVKSAGREVRSQALQTD